MKLIYENRDKIIEVCEKLKIKKLYAFGSVQSASFSDESDLDFLVAFIDNISFEEYSDNFFILHDELRSIFNRKIDLVTESSLSNPYFIKSVEKSKVLLYESKN